jgi:YVTN family beta-propeller protein
LLLYQILVGMISKSSNATILKSRLINILYRIEHLLIFFPIKNIYVKRGKYMINKKVAFYRLVSVATILGLVSSVGTEPVVYITSLGSNNVSVIDTAINMLAVNVLVGPNPYGVAVNPAGTEYVCEQRRQRCIRN